MNSPRTAIKRLWPLALALPLVVACTNQGNTEDEGPSPTTSELKSSTSQATTSQPEPTSTEAEETAPPQDSPRDAEPAAQEVEPVQTSPIAGKTISSCGDPSLHQFGTTFYTDGTSGWSETCNSQMRAAWTPQQYPEVEETVPLGEFVPAAPYTEPTFNPDSGDGYGPDQPLPPLCVRFPHEFEC